MTSQLSTLRCLAIALFAVLTGPLGCASAAPQLEKSSAVEVAPVDEAAVLAILEESATAWSAGDLEAFVSIYAEDCLFMTSSGLTRGRAAVLTRYRERYPDRQAMGTLQLEVVETRPAPPGGLAIAARWILAYPDRPAASGHTLVIFRRIDGNWRIVQDASM